MISPAIPLARMTKPALQDEWVRVRRFARTARTGTVREHAASIMKAIEKELAARKDGKPA